MIVIEYTPLYTQEHIDIRYKQGFEDGKREVFSQREAYMRGFDEGKKGAVPWVNVNTGMPATGQWVLCYTKELEKGVSLDTKFIVLCYNGGREWYTDEGLDFNIKCFEVTHWSSLPQPPKEQE